MTTQKQSTFFPLLPSKEKKARPLPVVGYDVIYADPPWRYQFSQTKRRKIENHYDTMALEDICALKVPSAKDSVLFMWVTPPKMEEGMRVINAWGFTYRTCMVWVKDKIGMGYYVRQKHEILTISIKGSPGTPEPKHRPKSVFYGMRREHSKKPSMYSLIEHMYPGRKYLELFARNTAEGWTSWGNQA